MSELTQFKIFFQGLVKPIINEAIEEAITKALSLPPAPTPPPADDYLSLKDAADFLSVAPQTMYQNTKRIPHIKRFGKLYFKRSELVAYLEQGATAQKKGIKP